MRIAITGGSGFIGRTILREYYKHAEFVLIGISNYPEGYYIDGKKFTYLTTDYTISSLLKNLVNIDAVIHLAAKRPESKGLNYAFSDFANNVVISSNLFEACKILNIHNIVNISSTSVYGSKNTIPYQESDKPKPEGYYGLSKVFIEDLADYYNRMHSSGIASLRLAHVIGAEERDDYMFKIFLNRAIHRNTLQLYGEGKGRREYIYVKDVANAIMSFAKKDGLTGVFNIGSGENTSHYHLARTINRIAGNDDNLEFNKNRKEDKSVDLMSSDKVKKVLNWTRKWSLEEGVLDILDNYTDDP